VDGGHGRARLDRAGLADEYGGGGLSPAETKILRQEMARIGRAIR
jgi:alkylation response protein AidB-like acyl-CoA dehydrogenase